MSRVSDQEPKNQVISAAMQRLQARVREPVSPRDDDHLDADTLAAFVEGRIEDSGARLITSHLIVCSACRRASAQVVHLETAVVEDDQPEPSTESAGGLRRLIDGLAARLLPADEGDVVFAYEDRSTPTPSGDEKADAKSSENEPGADCDPE